MKRKVIKQGHNTLTVTLPSDWVKRFNVKPGKEIDLVERNNGLFITTEKTDEQRRAEFDITGMDIPTIWKHFMSVYREGYDEILVKFDSAKKFENPYKFYTSHRLDFRFKKVEQDRTPLNFLQGFVNRFIGLEVVEHGKNFVLIKDMTSVTSKEFDSSLRRIFFLIQQMVDDTLEAIQKEKPEILSNTHDVDINLDKFHDYCIRILNKTSHKEQKKSDLLFSTLFILELLGDEFKNISVHLIRDFSKGHFKNIERLAESVKDSFDTYYDLFYKYSKEKVNKLSGIDMKTYFDSPRTSGKTSDIEKEIFHHLRIISRYINALLELRIEMEF